MYGAPYEYKNDENTVKNIRSVHYSGIGSMAA